MADQKEILESIRDIIAGKAPAAGDDDILDLTTVVNDDGSTTDISNKRTPPTVDLSAFEADDTAPISEESNTESDILSEIDSILGDKPEPEKPKPQKVELEFADFSADVEPEEIPEPIVPVQGEAEMNDEAIISDESAEAAKASISDMLTKIQGTKKLAAVESSTTFRSGNTVEDLVLETLKPMLKEWLDKNLSVIVKELVEKEIKRIIP